MTKGVDVMRSLLGLQERRDRTKLMDFFERYRKDNEPKLDPQTTPWCARCIGCCERAVGNPGTGKDNARSYLLYGSKVGGAGNLSNVAEGDIAVFARGNSNWQGHVTYVLEVKGDKLLCVGGNQGDQVSEAWYDDDALLSVRRPPNGLV